MPYLIELTLAEWLPGGMLRLAGKLSEIFAKIANALPIGYAVTDIWIAGKKLNFIVSETTLEEKALALPVVGVVAAVIAALWPILVLIGVVIIAWKVIDLFVEREITRQIIEKSELIEKAADAGLTPDQINDLLKGVERERISDILKWVAIIGGVMIIAIGGVIAYRELRKIKEVKP